MLLTSLFTNSYPTSLKPNSTSFLPISKNNCSLLDVHTITDHVLAACIISHTHLIQFCGSLSQSVLHANLSQASHPTNATQWNLIKTVIWLLTTTRMKITTHSEVFVLLHCSVRLFPNKLPLTSVLSLDTLSYLAYWSPGLWSMFSAGRYHIYSAPPGSRELFLARVPCKYGPTSGYIIKSFNNHTCALCINKTIHLLKIYTLQLYKLL